ncbi:MAG: 3D domain-containing protein [Chthoniobacteraceae bacterium]
MKTPAILRILLLIGATALAACTGVANKTRFANARSGASLATKAQRSISTSPARHMYVRTTAYHHSEPGGRVTAVGGYLKPTHSAAADWSWLPAGTRFRIVSTGDEYVVEDYGSALVGRYTIDLYKSTRAEMNVWGVRYVDIEILQLGSYPVSLAVLTPRQKYPHVRAMVAGLQKRVRG